MYDRKRDKKGRILHTGERQRENGKYEYRYKDNKGVMRSVYSWRLSISDPTPAGKKVEKPLRELEKDIQSGLDNFVGDWSEKGITLNEFFNEGNVFGEAIRPTTKKNYTHLYNCLVRDNLGELPLDEIDKRQIAEHMIALLRDYEYSLSYVKTLAGMLSSIFNRAIRKDLITDNPVVWAMKEVGDRYRDYGSKRHALTVAQQAAFIKYVSGEPKYKFWAPVFTFLLGTGCRVGEMAGLRWDDCDFENGLIYIRQNLVTYSADGIESENTFHIGCLKTMAGRRVIPMLGGVREALIAAGKYEKNKTVVDGLSGFVFQNPKGHCIRTVGIDQIIKSIVKRYNKEESKKALCEGGAAVLLPNFSVHILRHTFCTRFCENETNLKVIQDIMGHANIVTTMQIYNEATNEQKKQSFLKLEKSLIIMQ